MIEKCLWQLYYSARKNKAVSNRLNHRLHRLHYYLAMSLSFILVTILEQSHTRVVPEKKKYKTQPLHLTTFRFLLRH